MSMASTSTEKTPKQNAKRETAQIEIAASATPHIAVAQDIPVKQPKVEQEQEARDKAALESWEKLFEALFRINYPAQMPAPLSVQEKQAEHFARSLSAEYSFKADETKVVLQNTRSDIVVEQKKIVFTPAESATGEKNDLDLQSALVMARLAAQNPLMIEKGIRLKGSAEEVALLRRAIEQVNEALPQQQRLRIVDDAPAKPVPQPTPSDAFAQSVQPQSSQIPVQSPVKAVDTGKTSGPEKEKPQPVLQPAEQAKTQTTAPATAEKVDPQKEENADASKKAEKPDADIAETAKPAAEKKRYKILGRVIDAIKPKEIPFQEGRRLAVLGGGAAFAVMALMPDQSHAADMIQEAPRKRSFWEKLFGIKRNNDYEKQKADAGLNKKKPSAKKPKPETRKQKAARLKKEQEEAARAKKAKQDKPAKKETRAEKAERLKREKELARKKPEKKPETKAQKAERIKKEKEAAQANKKPETKAQKAERLKQEKAERRKDDNSKVAAKGKITFVNPHNGERMTANLRGLSSCCGQFNKLARDWRQNEVINIDSKLLDYIERICGNLQSQGKQVRVVNIHCGYRSPKTNQQLIAASKKRNGGKSGVAKNSYHLHGRALDISIEGVSTSALYNAACSALGNSGGARRYNRDGFVHIDTRGSKHRCIVS